MDNVVAAADLLDLVGRVVPAGSRDAEVRDRLVILSDARDTTKDDGQPSFSGRAAVAWPLEWPPTR